MIGTPVSGTVNDIPGGVNSPVVNNPESSKKNKYNPFILILLTFMVGTGVFFFLSFGFKTYQGVLPVPPKNAAVQPTSKPGGLAEITPKTENGAYINSDLGILLKHPEGWKLVKEDKDKTIWNIMSDSKVIGTVILRKNQVLGESTYAGSEQQIKSVADEIPGDKRIFVSGKSATETFTFSKDIDGKPNEITVELSIPDQDAIGSKKAAELHSDFDGVLRTISISGGNKTPDPAKSKIVLSKDKVKSDGIDTTTLTATIRDSGGNIIPDVYLEIIPDDPADFGYNRVISKSPLPTQRTSSAAVVLKDKIYVVAGRNYNDILSIVEAYSPATDSWTGVNSLRSQREELTLDEVNGSLYAIGGNKGIFAEGGIDQFFWDKVEMFNPAPGVSDWVNRKQMLRGRKEHASGVVGGKIYILTGMSSNTYDECRSNGGNNVEVYDTQTDSWSIASDKVLCIVGSSSVTIGDKIYLFGGQLPNYVLSEGNAEGDKLGISYDVNIFNTQTNSWEKGARMPHARNRGGLGLINGKVYLIGGFGGSKVWSDKAGENYNQYVDVYDPQSDSWTTVGEFFPTPIDFSYVTYNNKIYTFGGEHFYSWPYRNSVFEFNPLKTSREVIVNPSDESGNAQFKIRSLFPGSRSYKIVTYDFRGKQIEIGQASIFFE